MKDLVNIIVTNQPYKLGLELNIDSRELDVVVANHPNNHTTQLREVFSLYLRQCEEPSWVQVVTALRTIGERKIAKSIMAKFGMCNHTVHVDPHVQYYQKGTPYWSIIAYSCVALWYAHTVISQDSLYLSSQVW